MRSFSRILVAAGCSAVLMAVPGCGGDDESSPETTASSTATNAASGAADLSGQEVVFVGWGGVTGDTVEEAWLEPFSQETGAEAVYDEPVDPAKVKAMVESGNVTWDIVQLDGGNGGAGCGTLYKTREEMGIDMREVDPKYVSDECGVPAIVQAAAFMYSKERYGNNPPTQITDFLDTETFPGKRALFNYVVGSMEPLLLAAGTPPDEVYPYNYEVASAAFERVQNDVVLHSELAQQGEYLASDEFDMCICYNGRAAITPGVDSDDIGIVWDGTWNAWDMIYATKGSQVPEAQAAFLNYIAKAEAQNAFAAMQPYDPATIGPPPEVSEEFTFWMASANKDKMTNSVDVDYEYLQKPGVTDEAISQWTAFTSG